MKVDRSTQSAHRAALLKAASELFRARGVDGVTIAEISAAAGLTHGAFYGHFASKALLAEAALRQAAEASVSNWRLQTGQNPLIVLVDRYLTVPHRDNPGSGCALSALSGDAGRADGRTLAGPLAEMAQALTAVMAEERARRYPGDSANAHLQAARGALAAMQGGLILSRALSRSDIGSEEANEMLLAARAAAIRALMPEANG
jgi:TetR/AcrR family transcriptional repressor of nem operon